MNKSNRFALVAPFVIGLGVAACSDDGNLGGTGGPSGSSTSSSGGSTSSSGGSSTSSSSGGDPTKPIEDITGEITQNRTLTADKRYALKGLVKVKPGATLTIEKGVFFVSLASDTNKPILLVEAGAKIIAEGTADEPIVFTSAAADGAKRAGDWGGIVILGNAPVNFPGGKGNIEGIIQGETGTQYGGTNADDNSGVIRYVRVEYAGVVLTGDNEINGITFGGVGRGTKVDHVMVRHALDDCFEFFGGTVDAKYLICQYNQDDGFDMDNGYQGRLQFLVLQQDPKHPGEDNGFEIDNDAQGSANVPQTKPTVFNVTLIGKNTDPDSAQFGMLIRRNAAGSFNNMVFGGFEAGIDVRDPSTAANATGGALTFKGTYFWGMKGPGVLDSMAYPEDGAAAPNKNNDNAFDEVAWLKANGGKQQDPGLPACFDATSPVFSPTASITEGAVPPPNDGFFDTTATYLGAFKDGNDKWATTGKWIAWTDK